MFCGQCGNNISDGAKFCNQCGWKVPEVSGMPAKNRKLKGSMSATSGNNTVYGNGIMQQTTEQQEGQSGVTNSAPVAANVTEANITAQSVAQTGTVVPVVKPPKKTKRVWIWILLIVLVLGLGATATVLYIKYADSAEDEDDDRDSDKDDDEDDDGDDDGDSPKGPYGEYVSKSKRAADAQLIGGTLNALEVIACDPSISWGEDEIIYVKFTTEGSVYGSDNEEVISALNDIMGSNTNVSEWGGFELWAKKTEYAVEFATSWEYNELAEISPSLANRFSMTSVEQ